MENTTEEKYRFFFQYHGQLIIYNTNHDKTPYMVSKDRDRCFTPYELMYYYYKNIDDSYALLTSLSDITEEHAIEVANIIGYSDRHLVSQVEEVKEWLNDRFGIGHIKHKWDCLRVFDFLRKNSYAIPFDGKSVEELIELGWVKIRKS